MDKKGRVHSKKNIPVYFIPMKGTMGAAAAQMGIALPGQKLAKRSKEKNRNQFFLRPEARLNGSSRRVEDQ